MGIRFGHFDPLQLLFGVMNVLMQNGTITYEEARKIIKDALPPEMPEEEKVNILNSMIKKSE